MRTQEEIKAKIEEVKKDDFFGVQINSFIRALSYENAREYLKDEAQEKYNKGEETWNQETEEEIRKEAEEYFSFAVGKAEDHRGLSAGRSIDHYRAWLWLFGDDDKIDWDNYQNYGAPILHQIASLYGYKTTMSPEFVNMSKGDKCTPDCSSGCDR